VIKRMIGALLGFSAGACATTISWPSLPHTGFITGRTANESDIDRGDAVFVSRFDGELSGQPATLTIPQYAYMISEQGTRTPVIVVQAETNEQGTFFGLRDAEGATYVVTGAEVELLGSLHP